MKLQRIIFFLSLVFSLQTMYSQEYADKIDAVLDDNLSKTRGKFSEENGVQVLFYFDIYEKDSHAKSLQEKGFHGGGPTWLAILYTAFNIYEQNILDSLKYELSAAGITFKTNNKEDLIMIAKVIALIKSDESVMNSLIEEAKKLDIMK